MPFEEQWQSWYFAKLLGILGNCLQQSGHCPAHALPNVLQYIFLGYAFQLDETSSGKMRKIALDLAQNWPSRIIQ